VEPATYRLLRELVGPQYDRTIYIVTRTLQEDPHAPSGSFLYLLNVIPVIDNTSNNQAVFQGTLFFGPNIKRSSLLGNQARISKQTGAGCPPLLSVSNYVYYLSEVPLDHAHALQDCKHDRSRQNRSHLPARIGTHCVHEQIAFLIVFLPLLLDNACRHGKC